MKDITISYYSSRNCQLIILTNNYQLVNICNIFDLTEHIILHQKK